MPCTIGKEEILDGELEVEGKKLKISSVLMGVPHTMIFVENYKEYDIDTLGRALEYSTDGIGYNQ